MNRFKEDVLRELKDVKLTDQKKREMAQKTRMKGKVRRSSEWKYRISLATFTLCVMVFSILFSQNLDQRSANQQGATIEKEVESLSFWMFLENDLVRGFLLLSFFICAIWIVKRVLRNKGYGLPECIECGEVWSHKQARKIFWENRGIECPHCKKKQYRTKKSVQLGLLLNIPISLIAFSGQLFENFLVGIIFYLVSAIVYYYQLVPHLFDLQENDPTNDPLW